MSVPQTARFLLRTWGTFSLIDRATGENCSPRGRKTRGLLAFLAAGSRAATRDQLAALLWPDRGEEQAKASLRQCIAELRLLSGAGDELVEADRSSLRLRSAMVDDSIGRARRLGAERDFAGLAAMLDAGGEWLEDLGGLSSEYDLWLGGERARCRERLINTVLDACEPAVGEAADEIALIAKALRAIDPCDERAARLAMAVHAAQGDAAGVEREFQTLSRALQSELGVTPSSATLEARKHVSASDSPRRSLGARQSRRFIWSRTAAAVGLAGLAGLAVVQYFGSGPVRAVGPTNVSGVAVAAFSSDSVADERLALGIGEQVGVRLADYSGLSVLGPESGEKLAGMAAGRAEAAEMVGVKYLLQGKVTDAGNRIRIDVSLIDAAGGQTRWTQHFESSRDRLMEANDRLARTVAARLSAGDRARPASQRTQSTSGDVYGRYLTALSLIRDRQPATMDRAIVLLRAVVREDPRFAPAWAALSNALLLRATNFLPDAALDEVAPEASQYAQRAAALQPDLAETYVALGRTAGSGRATAYFERAAQLAPHDAEVWNILAQDEEIAGRYPRAMLHWRRMVAIDPLWWRAFYNASRLAADFGNVGEADLYLRRAGAAAAGDPFEQRMIEGSRAAIRGDMAAVVVKQRQALAVADPTHRWLAELALGKALKAVGRFQEARNYLHADRMMVDMWNGKAPSPAAVERMIAEAARTWTDEVPIDYLLRTLLREGRTAEIVKLYDARFADPEILTAEPVVSHAAMLRDAAIVAVALRKQGRGADADRLLALARTAMDRALSGGPVPGSYLYRCAGLFAASGENGKALNALEGAVKRGWRYGDDISFRDIAEEPLFQSLVGTPRFEQLRQRLQQTG